LPAGSPSFGFLAFLVAVVIVVAGVGVGLLYGYNHPKSAGSPTTVQVGDNVTVNYIGLFGSGPQQGKVFDTSLKSVARDNATWPKSLEYTPRNSSGYTPLAVHVGPAPSGGYNVSGVTYLGVVPGFWMGLVGLAVNQTRWATVPPAEGYGPLQQSCLRTNPLIETIPAVVTTTPAGFAKSYPGVTAVTGVTFADPSYGWTDQVLSANRTAVVVGREPTVGETTAPAGWTILVANVSSATITLESLLTPGSVGSVLGSVPGLTVCGTTQFLVWSVSPADGTFTANYNREVVGETLIFVVTVVTILPP
jgi:FKBP-type peptidyl-prolyl cis-trans isomerase 2